MADRQATQLRVEAVARATVTTPANRTAFTATVESIARTGAKPSAQHAVAETLARTASAAQAFDLIAESIARPTPPIVAPSLVVEVLRRETASAALRSTGYDAFGDAVWAASAHESPVGVFAFRHDWSEPVIERLLWRTQVERAASGQEVRVPLRAVPRRELRLNVGHGRAFDGLVADWLADHLGNPAWWPLHQQAVTTSDGALRGATVLRVDADATRLAHVVPLTQSTQLDATGLTTQPNAPRWIWIDAGDGWQVARITAVAHGELRLAEPLARAVRSGALVVPLVAGTALDAPRFAQWVPGVMGGEVAARVSSTSAPPWFSNSVVANDPLLAGVPVWPDANWRDDPQLTVGAERNELDLSFADPWLRRRDPERLMTLQQRVLAERGASLDAWLARLWHAQGRLRECWWPDGIAPVLTVTSAASALDVFLRVRADGLFAFWSRPAACVVLLPSGQGLHALTNAMQPLGAGESALMLRSPLGGDVPAGSRVLRLARCRLDHDTVDLVWHTTNVVEMALTARTVAEPRGNDRDLPYGED